jgi:formate dehydrogenase iron-sulfur subunit
MDLTENSWTVMRFAEVETDRGLEWLIRKDGCMHCADPGCLKACPAPGAVVQYSNGIVDFHEEHCIGCGYCITGCPFNIPRLSKKDSKVYKCTLCSDRVAVGLEPACVKACPTGAIGFGSKEDMLFQAEHRLVDLVERGFAKAAIYDPKGVGCRTVTGRRPTACRPTRGSVRCCRSGAAGWLAPRAWPPCSRCWRPGSSTTCVTDRSRSRPKVIRR